MHPGKKLPLVLKVPLVAFPVFPNLRVDPWVRKAILSTHWLELVQVDRAGSVEKIGIGAPTDW